MKKLLKKLFFVIPLLAMVLFTGCSEDVYEEKMYEANFEAKINYVNINQVPFLIPSIQKYNPDYGYLSNASSPSNKETLNLNLDLDRILEYVYANGLKSYSIIIKKEFTEYEDKYLENLHIYKKEGEYESIIFKYNSINDTQEFDKSTFTGELTAYDLDGNMIGIGQIENGFSKITLIIQIGCFKIYYLSNAGEYCVKNDCEEEGTSGGGGGDSSSGGSGSSGTGGDSGSGGSGSGSSGSSGGNTGGTDGVLGAGGVTVDILPNAPATSYTNAQTTFLSSLSNFAEDNFYNLFISTQNIVLGYVDNPNNQSYVNTVSSYINNNNSVLTWMSEQSEQTQNQVFNYLTGNNFSSGSQAFVGGVITNSLENPQLNLDFETSTKSPANIDLSRVKPDNPSDPNYAAKLKFMCIYNKIIQSPKFKELFVDLFQNNIRPNVIFEVDNLSGNQNGGLVGECETSTQNMYNNLITIDTDLLLNGNNMLVANTIIHECIHAFLNIKVSDSNLGISIPNLNDMSFSECVNTFYNNFGNDQNQHEFIYNYLIPTMSEILSDIKDLLVDSQINTNIQFLSIANSQGYSPWSWNDFYNNQALDGLQNCSFFQTEIATIGSNGYPINIINNNKWIIWNEYRTKSRQNLSNNCN